MADTEIHIFDRSSDRVELAEGSVLFRAGDSGDLMYAVIEGEVEIAIDGQVVETLGPGHVFGEMALLASEPRSATVTARTECVVVPIPQREFLFLVDEHPTFALKVMRTLAERLRNRSGPTTA